MTYTGTLISSIEELVEKLQGPRCSCGHLAKFQCEVCGIDVCRAHGRRYNFQDFCNTHASEQGREDARYELDPKFEQEKINANR